MTLRRELRAVRWVLKEEQPKQCQGNDLSYTTASQKPPPLTTPSSFRSHGWFARVAEPPASGETHSQHWLFHCPALPEFVRFHAQKVLSLGKAACGNKSLMMGQIASGARLPSQHCVEPAHSLPSQEIGAFLQSSFWLPLLTLLVSLQKHSDLTVPMTHLFCSASFPSGGNSP